MPDAVQGEASLDGITDRSSPSSASQSGGDARDRSRRREPVVYEIGGNVYGGANVYVREAATGKVYVVDAKVIRPLQAASRRSRSRDRRLRDEALKDMTVNGGEASASFEQHNRMIPRRCTVDGRRHDEERSGAAWIDRRCACARRATCRATRIPVSSRTCSRSPSPRPMAVDHGEGQRGYDTTATTSVTRKASTRGGSSSSSARSRPRSPRISRTCSTPARASRAR